MSRVLPPPEKPFDLVTDIVVIGAGACGLIAGLRALEAGAEVIVLERDATPSGSTALSSGFVPAPATRFQRALGLEDSAGQFALDIQNKAKGGAEAGLVELVSMRIGPALEWLADMHGIDWVVLDDFLYTGHSAHRMHAVPERTGAALMGRLLAAAEAAGLTLVASAPVTALFADATGRIAGVEITRPDGRTETVGCRALVLACNGYGGNASLLAEHIPEMQDALYFGHAGNRGDAVIWGRALGAALKDLTAYQGHGSVAHPHGILITWALMMQGGIQVNANGLRFSDEHGGYSEQAVHVLAQPGGIAWNIFDAPLHQLGLGFADYREAEKAGAVLTARTLEDLAQTCGLPAAALERTLAECLAAKTGGPADPIGRDFSDWRPLEAPFHAVRVTGALFHTQGGLRIDCATRVLRADGSPLPNLYAAGGAACGVSGARVEGYLSGNGLLTAIGLGFVAGREAALGALTGPGPQASAASRNGHREL